MMIDACPAAAIWLSGIVFAVAHSALADERIKDRCYRVGLSPRGYRLAYVLIAMVATALWLIFVRGLPDRPLYDIEGSWRWTMHLVQLGGLWIFWSSLRPIDVPAFLGLRPFGTCGEPFIEEGIYRHLRHPMYTGLMLILFAMPEQTHNSLHFFAVIACYFVIGSRIEERRMLSGHPEYADYRRRVPAFLPRLVRRS